MTYKTLKEIEINSALKVGAVCGGIVGLIYGLFAAIIFGIFGALMTAIPGMTNTMPLAGLGAGISIIVFFAAIIFGLIMGAVYGVLIAIIYNYIIVRLTEGLKIKLE